MQESHKIRIHWDTYNAEEVKKLFETYRMDGLPEDVVFDIECIEPPLGEFGLEVDILVAIIAASATVVTSLIGFVAQIISLKKAENKSVLEIQLDDETKIRIPANASKDEIESLLSIAKSIKSIEEIAVVTTASVSSEESK